MRTRKGGELPDTGKRKARFRIVDNARLGTVMDLGHGPGQARTFVQQRVGSNSRTEISTGTGLWLARGHSPDDSRSLRTYEEAFWARRALHDGIPHSPAQEETANRLGHDTGTPRFMAEGRFAGYVGAATDTRAQSSFRTAGRSVVEWGPQRQLVVDVDGKLTLVKRAGPDRSRFGLNPRRGLIRNPVEMMLSENSACATAGPSRATLVNSIVRTRARDESLGAAKRWQAGAAGGNRFLLTRFANGWAEFVLASIIDSRKGADEACCARARKRRTLAADAANWELWIWKCAGNAHWKRARKEEIHGYASGQGHPWNRRLV